MIAQLTTATATFFKGLPSIRVRSAPVYLPRAQQSGTLAYYALRLPGLEVVGANGKLLSMGSIGYFAQLAATDGGGGSGGGGHYPHQGYIDNLRRMSDSSLRKTINSLQRNIDEHLAKINADPASRAVPHWQVEIRNWEEELELAIEEATRRGIQ